MKYILFLIGILFIILIHLLHKNKTQSEHFKVCGDCDCVLLEKQNDDWSKRVDTYATQLNDCTQNLNQSKQQCNIQLTNTNATWQKKLDDTTQTYQTNLNNLVASKNQIELNYKKQIQTMTDSYNKLIDKMNEAAEKKKETDKQTNAANDASKPLLG